MKRKKTPLFSARQQALIIGVIKHHNDEAMRKMSAFPALVDCETQAALSVLLACAYNHKGQIKLTPSADPILGQFHK